MNSDPDTDTALDELLHDTHEAVGAAVEERLDRETTPADDD